MEKTKIFGPPGTGKTTRLLDILETELKTVDPTKVAFTTFTRAGANEAKDRARKRFGFTHDDLPYFSTLHSLAFRAGGYTRNSVVNKKHYKILGSELGMQFLGYVSEELTGHPDDKYIQYMELHRHNPAAAERFWTAQGLERQKIIDVQHVWKELKKYFGVADFTDMLESFVARNDQTPVEVAIIDEAQDLTPLQWDMAHRAFRGVKRLYIAGDDDQAIYEWAGANVNNFLDEEGRPILLDKSHRLPRAVLDYSKSVATRIVTRQQKEFDPVSEGGQVELISDISELDMSSGTWFLLSRNRKFLKRYEDHLQSRGRGYTREGRASIKQTDVKAINAWEHARKRGNLQPDEAVLVTPYVDQGQGLNAPWYDAFHMSEEQKTYYRDVLSTKSYKDTERIQVSTIHKVKGREAENVVIFLDVSKPVYDNIETNPDSELRVLYVGATRASQNLYLISPQTQYGYEV